MSERQDPTRAAVDPLLVASEGHRELLLGNEAIVRGALEAGVAFACGYPGTPSSEVTDSFARIASARGIEFEYSVNEKVALELAFAVSLAGGRSICAMKHLGLMAAGDPLSTIPYVGCVGGMVIVSAGDPSCITSPNEQDQRHLARMLHIPTLDPSTPQEACAMTRAAFDLSEQSRLPVLMRITTRVAHSRAAVSYGTLRWPRVRGFVRDPTRFVPIPANARKLRLQIAGRLETAGEHMAGFFQRTGAGRQAILACGAPAATCADLLQELAVDDAVILATLGAVHPLPEEPLVDLLQDVDRVLVVEELSPFIEDAVCALAARHGLRLEILGKRSGHLPEEFELGPLEIQKGIHDALGIGTTPVHEVDFAPVPSRPPVLCSGCPHRSTYFAARTAFGDDCLYFNDIGCYTLGYGPPLDTVDALLCMGAGFTLAAGVSRVTGRRTVGFLGDSTFFHSGMPALLNAIKENVNMVAVILDNQVTAMTGFQESPTVSVAGQRPSREVGIERVVRALGARQVESVDPADLSASIAAFERARDAEGISVIIAEHPCPMHLARIAGAPQVHKTYEVDHARCQSCGREGCGMRCSLSVTLGYERHMARSRALEVAGAIDAAGRDTKPSPVAPCTMECPLGLCVQGYAGHIAAGEYRQALELIMSRNPLPDSVCRVCHRPCEEVCVRAAIDEPVAINDLKRFVMDWAATRDPCPYDPPREPPTGRKVAVVGAGPAGLAAAHELRLRGHDVTLFDASDRPGGLLRTGIPRFRLPLDVLERDVERILDLGVTFVGNTALGRHLNLSALLVGYDAVLLGLGAHRPLALEVPPAGEGADGAPAMLEALEYLEGARDGTQEHRGKRVVVIGGGNAAIDSARTALRRGARHVVVTYRRGRENMPALADEIVAAEHEGVELCTWLQPVALKRAPTPGLACCRTERGRLDATGRPKSVPVAGSEVLVEADLVIAAVGQKPELAFLGNEEVQLELDSAGCVRIDPETGRTSHPKIFAAGDLVPAGRTVTEAIASGMRAAWGIDCALRGQETASRRAPPPRSDAWPAASDRAGHASRIDRGVRTRPDELPPERRIGGFEEVVGTLTAARARAEAARCAVCGQCGNCRACIDLFGCPAFYIEDGLIQINPMLCNGCGICAAFCPNAAIRPADSRVQRSTRRTSNASR
ncbi:MAG: FAD-dependent oxidoreductase [Candidatus Krumholzibacteriia bacterium]